MEYTQNLQGTSLSVTISGKFTFSDNAKFREIMQLVQASSIKALTIDLQQVEYVDSAALGMFLLARDTCEKNSCSLVLIKPVGQVSKMFEVSRFPELFTIQS